MTADIIDGMGISGTAGVFQRCAEETLRVLRDQSGVIMTVLEVFKHDPLHSWTVSEIKMKQIQSDMAPPTPVTTATNLNDTNINTAAGKQMNIGIGIDMSSGSADEAADRALSSVARKLDKSLSVQSTVNELIAEATDPMNLATLFSGKTFFFGFPWYVCVDDG
jgi:ataxia telangiectasia mutated family protein